MSNESMKEMINIALLDLLNAEIKMLTQTIPPTPMIRYKMYIWLHPDVSWPCNKNKKLGLFQINDRIIGYNDLTNRPLAVETLFTLCNGRPAKVLHLIYRIMATAKWCNDRAEGRGRAAKEILKQQANAVKALDEIEALSVLGELGKTKTKRY